MEPRQLEREGATSLSSSLRFEQDERLVALPGPLESPGKQQRHLRISGRKRSQSASRPQRRIARRGVLGQPRDGGREGASRGTAIGVHFQRLEKQLDHSFELTSSEPGVDGLQPVESMLQSQQGSHVGGAENRGGVESLHILLSILEAGERAS